MRSPRITSALGALLLAAGALLTAQPAAAGDPNGPTPPAEFTTDWHDPVTAAPPVDTPGTPSCEVVLAAARFRDFTPYRGSYTPPKVGRTVTRTDRTYTMDGETTVGAGDRLRTVLTLGDRADTTVLRDGRPPSRSRLDDTYTGDATYTTGVPREERHAVGTTTERYRLYGSGGCHDRTLTAVQGTVTRDLRRC